MRKFLYWLALAIFIMIGLPFVAVVFCGGAGMAVCFILFFAVDPAFSVISGVFAGLNIKKLWFVSLAVATLFLTGVWIFFAPLEMDFLIYAAVYFTMSVLAMGGTALTKFFLKK